MLVVPGGRQMTFEQVTPGHLVNHETGVSLRKGLLGGLVRWYVYSPVNDHLAVAVRLSQEAAERYARLFVIVEMRNMVADVYDHAVAQNEARG
jgi:hypothetical protein